MRFYCYHPVSRAYLGEKQPSPCPPKQEKPLENFLPQQALRPAHSTPLAPPPLGAWQTACFIGGEWFIRPDYRGTRYWDQGRFVTINEIGETPPEGARIITEAQFSLGQSLGMEILRALSGQGARARAGLETGFSQMARAVAEQVATLLTATEHPPTRPKADDAR